MKSTLQMGMVTDEKYTAGGGGMATDEKYTTWGHGETDEKYTTMETL
jgi:hypothetical protein